MKTVFVPRETADNETRTALIPQDVSILTRTGFEITVESGTGVKSGYLDADYAKAGAKVVPAAEAGQAVELINNCGFKACRIGEVVAGSGVVVK